jgi:hypothetical protein
MRLVCTYVNDFLQCRVQYRLQDTMALKTDTLFIIKQRFTITSHCPKKLRKISESIREEAGAT